MIGGDAQMCVRGSQMCVRGSKMCVRGEQMCVRGSQTGASLAKLRKPRMRGHSDIYEPHVCEARATSPSVETRNIAVYSCECE